MYKQKDFILLDHSLPVWEHFFTVAPLVVIGTKEGKGYDLAPKHLAIPISFGNYFGFVCTPRHGTYQNVLKHKEFTVSFPLPDQIVLASLAASPRNEGISKFKQVVGALPTIKASTVDAKHLKESYLRLECELFKIIDGFDENSIVTGKIKAAFVHKDYQRISDQDEQQQLKNNPLLVYLAPGRFAKITETYNFPFPKNFER